MGGRTRFGALKRPMCKFLVSEPLRQDVLQTWLMLTSSVTSGHDIYFVPALATLRGTPNLLGTPPPPGSAIPVGNGQKVVSVDKVLPQGSVSYQASAYRYISENSRLPAFDTRSSSFYQRGRVFVVLWHESAGAGSVSGMRNPRQRCTVCSDTNDQQDFLHSIDISSCSNQFHKIVAAFWRSMADTVALLQHSGRGLALYTWELRRLPVCPTGKAWLRDQYALSLQRGIRYFIRKHRSITASQFSSNTV